MGEKPAVWQFAIDGDHTRPLFAFPRIWRTYTGPLKKDGEIVFQTVYAFMTTDPNEMTVGINHECMPVLLSTDDEFDTWLNGTTKEAFAIARPYPADEMHIVQAGPERKDLLTVKVR